jgi:tetratricopeptide (TPR) repeat protein
MGNTASVASSLKDKGNALFSDGDYGGAVDVYTQAIALVEDARLYSNRSASFSKLSRHFDALLDARDAHRLAPAWPKPLFRQAQCLIALGDPHAAYLSLTKAAAVDPLDPSISSLLLQIRSQLDAQPPPPPAVVELRQVAVFAPSARAVVPLRHVAVADVAAGMRHGVAATSSGDVAHWADGQKAPPPPLRF